MKQQQSLEIRWFFKGDRGRKHTLDWVRTIEADKNNPESTRTDFYLNNFYNGALGIKLRENQLEIKTRLEGLSQHGHQ
jgi:hypothetical protein